MINEDQLEQLAIQWFQDTDWSYAHEPDIAKESAAPERSDFREVSILGTNFIKKTTLA